MEKGDVSNSGRSGVVDVNELSVCPSFSAFYSDRQAAAARAVNDVLASTASCSKPRSELDEDEFGFATGRFETCVDDEEKEEEEEEGEFEFSILSLPEGQIYPIFDRDLVGEATVTSASVSLKKLFIDEEREDRVADGESESESELENELESVEPGTYCVWKPKTSPSQTPTLSPKSKSTGSCSKRWRLRDLLLRRSNSDGKESFVYLTTPTSSASASSSSSNSNEVKSGSIKLKSTRRASGEYMNNKSAHEMFYVEKRAVKEEDRKRSYLPYRKGLVGFGFFPNGMGVTNNFRPF